MKNKFRGLQWSGTPLIYPRYASCVHFEPAIIKHGKIIDPAKSYMDGRTCHMCGASLTHNQVKRIEELVAYLNQMGDNDKIIAKLYEGIDITELAKFSITQQRENGATLKSGAVPCKNIEK